MALTDEGGNGMVMPVAPMYGNGGMGGFGSDWAWIIILLLCGWGGMGGLGMGGFGGGLGVDFPWILNGQNAINANTNSGFDHAATQSALGNLSTAVTSGFGDVATQLCGGFAGVNANVNNGINSLAQQMNSNEIASLERSFAAQTANTAGLTNISSQLNNCCCENRLATCQTQNIVATEGAATRAAIQSQTQAILDKMCQQEIDALKAQNTALQNQVLVQTLAASQTAQTRELVADNTAQTQYIVNRVAPYPIPAYTVANPVTPAI